MPLWLCVLCSKSFEARPIKCECGNAERFVELAVDGFAIEVKPVGKPKRKR
jgi:hypothetical protein